MRFLCLALCLVLGVIGTEDSAVRSKRAPLLGGLLGGNVPLIGGLLGGGGGNTPKPTTTTPKPTTAAPLTQCLNVIKDVCKSWQESPACKAKCQASGMSTGSCIGILLSPTVAVPMCLCA